MKKYLKGGELTALTSVILAIIGVALSIIPYFMIAKVINGLLSGNIDENRIILYILVSVCSFILSIAFNEFSTLTSHRLAFHIIEKTREELAEKLSRLSMGTIQGKSSGKWSQFMGETLDKMEKPIAHIIPEILANFIIPIVILVILFVIDWRIGLANLVTLPFGILFLMLMMKDYEANSKVYVEASKVMNTTVVEYVNGIKVIKAFNQSASSYEKFINSVNKNRDSMLDWYLGVCFAMTAAMEILPSTLLFVLPTGMYLFMNGAIEVSVLITCVLLSYALYKPLVKAMQHLDTGANLRVIMAEIDEVMSLKELKRPDDMKNIINNDITFENVDFAYDDKLVLKDLNMKAKQGEMTAIVGPSGGGKSTIAKLIVGFFNTQSGSIKIGDTDIRNLPLKQNMELVTYVSQENYLFNESIYENLKLGNPNASRAEIINACKKAGCHEFIMKLKEKYETVVGEAGSHLSGGERQRITIARSLLKNSPIIVLDEATAYADPENESLIQKSINALVKDKTVIIIAHRLSTIIGADSIYVIENGKVVDKGKHDELLKKSSIYKTMWNSHIEARDKKEASL